jgi:hypothetical protein
MRVRKVHLDYAGADGFPKPMEWFLAADGCGKAELEARARAAFAAIFPEWTLRHCEVEDADADVRDLQPCAGVAGVWIGG